VYEAYRAWEDGKAPDWDWYSAPSWENRFAFKGGREDPEIVAAERDYTAAGLGALFQQEYGGRFVQLEGLVFGKWEPRVHVTTQAAAKDGIAQWFVGYDWGWEHHTAALLIGRTSGGDWRVVDEWGGQTKLWGETTAGIAQMCAAHGVDPLRVERIYLDPSRPEQAADMRRLKWPASGAVNDLAPGILAVAQALGRDGGLLVSDTCRMLIRQMGSYQHAPSTGTGDVRVKKVDDDYVDALRYVLASARRADGQMIGVAYPGGR
jgi:hypothetical protein